MPHLPDGFAVPPVPDSASAEGARQRLDTLTKPPGSLGELESLVVTLAGLTGTRRPRVTPPGLLVFAADHGVAAEGVSAFPQAVTAQMVANFAAGGAAINVLARQLNARLEVIDVGVASPVTGPGVVADRVRPGTANLAAVPAMTRDEARAALAVGQRAARRAAAAGCRCLIVGDMGIANTTASSALLAALSGLPAAALVGPGTGVDAAGLARKRAVIERALATHAPDPGDPLGCLAALGGLEIAAMAGAYLEGGAQRLPLLVDGFIATVAALVACRLAPALRPYLIFGHRSAEPGHAQALAVLQAEPLLALGLRLGEGSGAALAFPLLEAACRLHDEMATFDSAGVAGRDGG